MLFSIYQFGKAYMAKLEDFFETFNAHELRQFAILNSLRILEIIICAGLLGAGISGILLSPKAQAQNLFSIETQVAHNRDKITELAIDLAQQKITGALYEKEIAALEAKENLQDEQIASLRDQQAVMHGIGIAVGAVLMVLTFLQLWFTGKFSKTRSSISVP